MAGVPSVTVALQTRNRADTGLLRIAMEAVLAQTYADFELLVLDNHSTDSTSDLVLGYRDPRLIYIRQPPGRTADTNFNSALWMARGKYVLITHDDDVMEPTMIGQMVRFLSLHPNIVLLATNVSLIDSQGATVQRRLYEMERDRIFRRGEYLGVYLKEKLWLPTPTCMFHRDKTVAVKGPQARATSHPYQPSADIAVACLLNAEGPIAILAEPLLRYRQHPGQESRNVDQSQPLVATMTELLKHRSKFKAYLPALHAAHLRYLTQDHVFDADGIEDLKRKLRKLKSRWERLVPASARAQDSVLPFEILATQCGLKATIETGYLGKLLRSPCEESASRAYRQWTCVARQGGSIFRCQRRLRRVAILGSMLSAALIALDARHDGVEVVCCIDSAPARIGRTLLGIPILPHGKLLELRDLDAVILSSERSHETALRKMLRSYLPNRRLATPSWKDLVQESYDLLRLS